MNYIDFIIVAYLVLGVAKGFFNGFFKETVSFLGFIVVTILAFIIKAPLANFFMLNLPFIKFGGIFTDVSAINILFYEFLAFIIVYAILFTLFRVIIMVTGLFETLLKMTIVLAIPSKILGAIVGFFYAFVSLFFVLIILNLPLFNIKAVNESKLNKKIINDTPILSDLNKNIISIYNEIDVLIDGYTVIDNNSAFNDQLIDIMLKYNVTSKETVEKLVEKDKISIKDYSIITKYE